MNDQGKLTRRQIVAGLGTTLAAAAISPAFAVPGHSDGPGDAKISNPRELYPKPPFKSQPQPWPGLQSKMDPVPDCGEKSYKGSGRLMGRKALITGGDSGMGRAAAIAYAREGADVAINYFPTEEPDAQEVIALIKKEGRKAVAIPGDLRQEDFCKHLVQKALSELGGLDIIVN
ncbi:MAG: SDR family NAD(P)-dependent oxidoreductase, partial [Mucilaginibacter sp.]|nr:SDR family NAD(P)-dependent oxidoreductase [Mucilaginibacter sp.]